ncbi:hypothetical protein KAR91_04835 [Candidatus Pacearchaeota archaeon]|nr:hypothetical protein [Candidatus Pacearchaeota archaeon]
MKRKIRILGYEHTVELKPRLGSAGRSSLDYQSIELDPEMCEEQLDSTLIHEVIHQINKHLSLALNEGQISGLEAGMYSFLKDGGVDLGVIMETGETLDK